MPESYDDPAELEYRREVESQLNSLRDAAREAGEDLAWNTEEAVDHDYLYVPGRLLLDAGPARRSSSDAFGRRGEFPPDDPTSDNRLTRDDRTFAGNLVSYSLPRFTESRGSRTCGWRSESFDEELGRGAVTPEHYRARGCSRRTAGPALRRNPRRPGVREEWPPARPGSLARR